MTLRDYLKLVVHGDTLSHDEAAHCCELLFSGDATHADIGALLCALHARGETIDELSGFLQTMRANMTRVECDHVASIDMCGTGGDGSHSFNLSTAAALLASACGATVAKHGNRAISSRSGSADLIEALSIPFCASPHEASASLTKKNFAFLFAPNFHPAMKSVAPIRKELGVRTIFNLLGPLANPAKVKRQMIGVYSPKWLRPIVETLAHSGSELVIAIHADGGLDEVTLNGQTQYCMLSYGNISEGNWDATNWGITSSQREYIEGGTAEENAKRVMAVATGSEPQLRDWIIANCAPALLLSGQVESLSEGVSIAREAVSSGAFYAHLESLRAS